MKTVWSEHGLKISSSLVALDTIAKLMITGYIRVYSVCILLFYSVDITGHL